MPDTLTPDNLEVLYEDNHLLVVYKPAGVLVQGDHTGDISLLDVAKAWLIEKYHKPGQAFVGLVHRLDRPVSGVVVLAKTSKAAGRLSEQFREKQVQKTYIAVVEGMLTPLSGTLRHYILRQETEARVQVLDSPTPGAKAAELTYTVLDSTAGMSLVEIEIATGRHHQIRAQLGHLGHPIVFDVKYGSPHRDPLQGIALIACRLAFDHPITHARLTFTTPMPSAWPWSLFHPR